MSIARWLLAALLTLTAAGAGHAQTASFSILGLPALFGQESQATASVMPWLPSASFKSVLGLQTADGEPEVLPCPTLCQIGMLPAFLPECLRQWQAQWDRGNYQDAGTLAAIACKLDPASLAAQHALVVSEIMTLLCGNKCDCHLFVTTPEEAKGRKKMVTFDVADLVSPEPKPTCGVVAPLADLPPESNSVEALIEVIQNAIEPQSWQCAGGQGTIQYYPLGQALVINNTNEVLEQVADLLVAIRLMPVRSARLQVARVKSTLDREYQNLDKWFRLLEDRCAERRAYEDALAKKLALVEAGNKPVDLDILEVQRRLVLAQTKECEAIAEYNAALARFYFACGTIGEAKTPRVNVRAVLAPAADEESAEAFINPCPAPAAFTPFGQGFSEFNGLRPVTGLTPAGTLTPDLGIDCKACCKEGGACAVAGAAKPSPQGAPVATAKCCCANGCACCKCGAADNRIGAALLQAIPMFLDGPAAWLVPAPDPFAQVLEMIVSAAMDKVACAVQSAPMPVPSPHQVHLVTPHFEAHCQRLTSSGTSDHLVLEGDVQLTTSRNGQTMRVSGQRIVVHLSDGAFTVEAATVLSHPLPPLPVRSLAPVMPYYPVQPAVYVMPSTEWNLVRPVRPINETPGYPAKPNE